MIQKALLCLVFLLLTPSAKALTPPGWDTIYVEIHSMDDWKANAGLWGTDDYSHKYGVTPEDGESVCPYYLDVKLFCDLTFDNSSTSWQYFSGHFDGQGHTINVSLKGELKDRYVFGYIGGTFENLNIKGSIEYRYGIFSYAEVNPFACQCAKELTLINCHSRIDFLEVSDHSVGKFPFLDNSTSVGGFLGGAWVNTGIDVNYDQRYYCNVHFQDCSFVNSSLKIQHDAKQPCAANTRVL